MNPPSVTFGNYRLPSALQPSIGLPMTICLVSTLYSKHWGIEVSTLDSLKPSKFACLFSTGAAVIASDLIIFDDSKLLGIQVQTSWPGHLGNHLRASNQERPICFASL